MDFGIIPFDTFSADLSNVQQDQSDWKLILRAAIYFLWIIIYMLHNKMKSYSFIPQLKLQKQRLYVGNYVTLPHNCYC